MLATKRMPPITNTMATTRQNVSLRRIRRRSTITSASSDIRSSCLILPPQGEGEASFLLGRLFGALLERGAQDVAERSTGIGGAVLGDRLLLLCHFERLDRHRDLVAAAIELRHAGIHLLADRETLRPL